MALAFAGIRFYLPEQVVDGFPLVLRLAVEKDQIGIRLQFSLISMLYYILIGWESS